MPASTLSMNRWNDCPAFRSPNGMRRKTKRPNGVMTAVFMTSFSATGIW